MKKVLSFIVTGMFMLLTFQNQSAASTGLQVKNSNGLTDFCTYLGNNILYPAKAKLNRIQGNSIISFVVTGGKVKDLKIQTALGAGCDGEVLNSILAYPNFAKIKNGKYALKTTFKLNNSDQLLKNATAKVPTGYEELNIVIVGAAKEAEVMVFKPQQQTFGEATRLRGNKQLTILSSSDFSKTAGKEPMVVLNDKIIEYGSMYSINPNNIESITILKDISAIAKYGTDAKNGVIIIISKDFNAQKLKTATDTLKKN